MNDNRKNCYKREEISNIKEFFLSEDKTTYLSCKQYNINKNCMECSTKDICKKCDNGYYLYEGGCTKSDNENYLKICHLYLLYLIVLIFF